MVAKRSGVTEPFTREKIIRGVRRACQGRPVGEDQLAILAQRVEDTIRARGCAEIGSHEVGLAILGPLRELDEVAYLRFASVYRGFDSLADFEEEIALLRAAHANVRQLQRADIALRSDGLGAAPARGRVMASDTARAAVTKAAADPGDSRRDTAEQATQDTTGRTTQGTTGRTTQDMAQRTSAAGPSGAMTDPSGSREGRA